LKGFKLSRKQFVRIFLKTINCHSFLHLNTGVILQIFNILKILNKTNQLNQVKITDYVVTRYIDYGYNKFFFLTNRMKFCLISFHDYNDHCYNKPTFGLKWHWLRKLSWLYRIWQFAKTEFYCEHFLMLTVKVEFETYSDIFLLREKVSKY